MSRDSQEQTLEDDDNGERKAKELMSAVALLHKYLGWSGGRKNQIS